MREPADDPVAAVMRRKGTEELLAIWRENDRETWTGAAFTAVKALLLERGADLPPQQDAHDRPVATPAPQPEDPDMQPVAIGPFPTDMDAEMVRLHLDGHGIPGIVIGATEVRNTAAFAEGGRVRLLVRRGDLERAVRIIEEGRRAGRLPTELIAAQAPAGRGTEPEAAGPGRGTEPEAAPDAPAPAAGKRRRRWWPW